MKDRVFFFLDDEIIIRNRYVDVVFHSGYYSFSFRRNGKSILASLIRFVGLDTTVLIIDHIVEITATDNNILCHNADILKRIGLSVGNKIGNRLRFHGECFAQRVIFFRLFDLSLCF